MPIPTDATGSGTERPGPPAGDDDRAPQSIWSAAAVWELRAAPATLEAAATTLRGLGTAGGSAQSTVDTAARQVEGEDSWQGDTADAYQGHRSRVTRDLGSLGTVVTSTADALDVVASSLRSGQAMLDELRDGLSTVEATTTETGVRFHPADAAEASRVRQAITAAAEVRTWVDEQLVLKTARFQTAQISLAAIAETWRPRSLRVLDLNIGQGYGNSPFDSDGTDRGDIDEIGAIIDDSGADVVTLQEVFERDAENLQEWLDENTDGEWELHFAAASHKFQFDDSIGQPNRGDDGFGNVVLVRTGDTIESSEELDEVTLEEPGNLGVYGSGPEGRSMEGARITFGDD